MKLVKLINQSKAQFFIYGIGQAFNLVSPIIVAPYIISICSLAFFGKASLAFAFSLFLILIVDYGFDIKGTKKVSENRNNLLILQDILFTTVYTKIILAAIAFLIATLLIVSIPLFANEKVLFFLSFTIVFAQVFNPIWFLQGLEDFKTSSWLNILSKLSYVSLVFCFVKIKSDYNYVNFFLGFSSFFFNIIGLIIIKKRYNFNFVQPKIRVIKSILAKDFFFCISQLFLSLRQLAPMFLSSYFFGFNFTGQYKIIEQIISLFRTFNQVYLKYFFPRLCYKITLSINDALFFWKRNVLKLLICVLIALLLIFLYAQEIVSYFNIEIVENTELISVMRFSLIIPFLMVFSLSLEQLMLAFNNNKGYIKTTILVAIINIVLLLILLPIFKLYGVILSLLIAEVFFIFLFYTNTITSKKTVNKLANKLFK